MPVLDYTRNSPYSKFLKRLVAEWKGEETKGEAPTIRMEGGSPGRPTRVFVKWDEWAELNHQERASIILDAAEEVLGLDASLEIMTPMGLTAKEAEEMGIQFPAQV